MAIQLPLHKVLKTGLKVELDWISPQEYGAVRSLLNDVILEGQTYPQSQPLSEAEFAAYWLAYDAFVVRTIDPKNGSAPAEILGAFYLKPNFPGRCSHIANAGFIVQPSWRGRGMGRLMGEAMLELAARRGYTAVMFNLVFASNIPSLNLWLSLGFETIGRIPHAAHLSDGRFVDALMLYRALRSESPEGNKQCNL